MRLKKNSIVSLRFLKALTCAAIVGALVTVGCEEDPLGYDELERGELSIHQVVLEPDTVVSFSKQIELGEASTLFGGRDSLTEARILIAIEGLDSLAVFDSVKLVLRRYRPDTVVQSNMNFSVYPLLDEWDEADCTWWQSDADFRWTDSRPGGAYDSTDLIGQLLVEADTVEFFLDPDRLEVYNRGVILIPANDGFCYLGSDERSEYPPQVLGFRDEDTTAFSSAAGVDYYAAVKDATILRPYEVLSPDTLVGAGLAWRTFMHFTLDTLPENIDITSADIHIGYENYFFPEDSFDFVLYRLEEPYAGRFSKLATSVAGREQIGADEDSLAVSFGGVVELWLAEPDTNYGVVFMHSAFSSAPSYGQENRMHALGRLIGVPRLVITYTNLPSTRFGNRESGENGSGGGG